MRRLLFAALLSLALSVPALAAEGSDPLAQAYAGLDGVADKAAWKPGKPYRNTVGGAWRTYQKRIGVPAAAWAKSEIGFAGGNTVFYPFSGPDLVTVMTLFPDADRYVLAAIQSARAPVDPAALDDERRAAFYAKFGTEWQRFGTLGYFRTIDLDEDAQDDVARIGVTPILMGFAARLGYEVTSAQPLAFDTTRGDYEPTTDTRQGAWGSVRLTLVKAGKIVTVDYVRIDLSNGYLKSREGRRAWIERMAGNPTLLKAASHLLQDAYFSILRDALVANAPLVVQDETGLEFRDLARVGAVKLYGSFKQVHGLFDKDRQKTLAAAYRDAPNKIEPLPFAFSYLKGESQRSLQIARR
jgi:hypothetical protein